MAFNFSAPSTTNTGFTGNQQWQAPGSSGNAQPWQSSAPAGGNPQPWNAPAGGNLIPSGNPQPWNAPANTGGSQPWNAPGSTGSVPAGAPAPWGAPAPTGNVSSSGAPAPWNGGVSVNTSGTQNTQNQPWNAGAPTGGAPWGGSAPAGANPVATATPVETKTGLEILGDSLVEIFDRYVKIQCLPHLVEGLQKEGIQVNVEKLESLLPQKTTVARSALLSSSSSNASTNVGNPAFNVQGNTQGFPASSGQTNQFFGAAVSQAGAFNAGGFMPQASASNADKNSIEKAKLAAPNFNDNFKQGCCLSYPVRGNDNKYKFCGNPVASQYTIVCEKCRTTRAAAKELDAEFTMMMTRGQRFDFEAYRRSVTQKRLDYANGVKSGKKSTTQQVPTFGFNPMDGGFPGMMNTGGMPQQFQPQQQQQHPTNNGPPREATKYIGPIPPELSQFSTPEYGTLIILKNHSLVATMKDIQQPNGGTIQQIIVIGAANSREGPIRKTTPEDWNMIKISNLKHDGPFVINYDQNPGQYPTVPQPGMNVAWGSGQQSQPQPWNPNQGGAAPWSNTASAPFQNTNSQPQPWNPNQNTGGVTNQTSPSQPQPWNPSQSAQPAQQQNPWSNPGPSSDQQQQQQHQSTPWSNTTPVPIPDQQQQQPQQQPTPSSQPQPSPNQQQNPWSQPQPEPTPNQNTPETSTTTQSNLTANIASTDASISFDAIVAGITSTQASTTPGGSAMVVQQF